MSEIRATTISDAAGTGPIALTKQSAAKAWMYGQQDTLTDSFGISTITDDGIGLCTLNLTSTMNYTVPVASGICRGARVVLEYEGTHSASVVPLGVRRTDATGFQDSPFGVAIHGDLA